MSCLESQETQTTWWIWLQTWYILISAVGSRTLNCRTPCFRGCHPQRKAVEESRLRYPCKPGRFL
jgi:hypothetical protein